MLSENIFSQNFCPPIFMTQIFAPQYLWQVYTAGAEGGKVTPSGTPEGGSIWEDEKEKREDKTDRRLRKRNGKRQ